MIYFAYNHALVKTGVMCKEADFDKECGVKKSDANWQMKVGRLNFLKGQIMQAMGDRILTDAEFSMICMQIMNPEKYAALKAKEEEDSRMTFIKCFEQRMQKVEKPKSAQIYAHTLSLVKEFGKSKGQNQAPSIDDITGHWLEDFEQWLKERGTKTNGIGIHMRNIRTVCNFAIKEGYTTNYPFRQYRIKKEATAKRCLTVEQLRMLRDFPCDKIHERYRDVFMLMFYFRGVNGVDLFNATHDNIRNGRFEYRRSKTGHFFSIKIEPEAQAILDKYSGGEHLLNMIDNCKWDTFMQHMDKELKKIGPTEVGKHGKKDITPLFPDLTSYWSRHTWATMAAEIDIPKDTIGKALGHEWACVTDTYIKFNEKKVDDAARQVIDYLNGSHKTQEQWQAELRQQQEEAQKKQEQMMLEAQKKQEQMMLEAQHKQDELLEANRRMQEQLLRLMEKIA